MATGGGTKNPAWLQMIADITGKNHIDVPASRSGQASATPCWRRWGIEYFDSYDTLAHMIKPGSCFTPRAENHETYKKYQAIFDSFYVATKDLMHRL